MIKKERFENIVEQFFENNNDFFTLQDVEILRCPSATKFRVELLGENENECFTFSFDTMLIDDKYKKIIDKELVGEFESRGLAVDFSDKFNDDEVCLLKNLQKSFNKLIAKFKANLDYEKELIDSGDLERWVKQDGFTLKDLQECKEEYMSSLDIAVNRINKDINGCLEWFEIEQGKGEER